MELQTLQPSLLLMTWCVKQLSSVSVHTLFGLSSGMFRNGTLLGAGMSNGNTTSGLFHVETVNAYIVYFTSPSRVS